MIFLREHGEAVEYDLARMHIDLSDTGTPALSWRRLRVLVGQLAEDRSSNLWRELAQEWADWTPTHQILAAIVNALRIANWQRTDDAGKRSPRHFPEGLLPPGMSTDQENRQTTKFGNSRMSMAQADEWLGW